MINRVVFSAIIICFLTSIVPSPVVGFSTSDMAGDWYVYSIEVDSNLPAVYWLRGFMEVNESGNIIQGTYIAPDNSIATITSGQFNLNFKGIISGSFTAEGNQATVVHGKLDNSKTIGAAVLAGTDNTLDIVTFIKAGGTFNNSDLEGTWYGYQTLIDATTGAVFWVFGTYTIDASGNISGSYEGPDGSTVTIESGNLVVDSEGIITGNLSLSNGQTTTIVHGKLDQSKTLAVGISIEPGGVMGISYQVKAGGVFDQRDMAENLYAYGLIIDPSLPAVYWVYGNLRVDSSGSFVGVYNAPTGDSVGGSGVTTMDSMGVITGTVSFDTGDTGIVYFKQDQSKSVRIGVTITTSGVMGIWQFFKSSPLTVPGVQLLLIE